MFGLFRSSVIDEFKEKLEKVQGIKKILDDCRISKNVDKCFSYPLIDDDDDDLKNKIERILQTYEPGVEELKDYIKEKTNIPEEKIAFIDAISDGKKRGVYLCVANYVIDKYTVPHHDNTAIEARIESGKHTLDDLDAVNTKKDEEYEKYKKDEMIKEKEKEEENPLPRRIRQPQGAGKSRRRHRRGRTLHKRRKSRKVRKTRCRRK
jgi:hypothetical protein